MSYYLGFDSSTQSLTAIVIEVTGDQRRVVLDHSLRFDETFPHYETSNGVLPRENRLVAHSSPLLWAEALDTLMGWLARDSGLDLSRVEAIAGSGQQHGSVYLNADATAGFAALNPDRELQAEVAPLLSRATAPIWMDSSTTEQCKEITDAIGGWEVLSRLTGSRAFERFTGPQIRKFYQVDPEGYARTDRIHLVSSYLASLLAGCHAPIDPGDGAGMNLMDLGKCDWAPAALAATAPELERRLPKVAPSSSVIGTISPYWVERYGFSPTTAVVAWSGDNPCSLIGVGLVKPGRVAISLGTSDTLFGVSSDVHVDPTGVGHVFGSPTGDYMSLICFKNGSLARDAVRRELELDWEGFSAALQRTVPGNGGAILLPWFEPEITPPVHQPGARRYGFEGLEGRAFGDASVRAVVEAQMLATWSHSQWIGANVDRIYATGGASRNRDILRVMADVHDAEVFQFEVGNSAGLGAALRAFHAAREASRAPLDWDEVICCFAEPVRESRLTPDPVAVARYAELKRVYRACEDHARGLGDDPTPLIEEFRSRRS